MSQPAPQRRETPAPRKKRGLLLPLIILGFFGFLILLMVIVVVIAFSSGGPKPVKVTSNSVLELHIEGNIYERNPVDPFQFFDEDKTLQFHDILAVLERAAGDPKIKGVSLEIGMSTLGWAQAQELRDGIKKFKESQKWVIANGGMWMEKEYFLASVADEVYMAPEGLLFLDGFSISSMFYGELFQEYGINVYVSAFGEYKSYADPYRYKAMTEPNRQALTRLLDGIQDEFLARVCESREKSVADAKADLDTMIHDPQIGVEKGWLDGLLYQDQIKSLLADKMSLSEPEDVNIVPANRYFRPASTSTFGGGDTIAVIYGEGNIVPGGQDTGFFSDTVIASADYIDTLRSVREKEHVKAIVLRIDSPGGSLLASDDIWREIQLTRERGIPVIASMGNFAASGGYYLAMACDKIVADPTTITGSIGVVSMRVDFEKLYSRLMVNAETVKTAPSADFWDGDRELTQAEKDSFDSLNHDSYVGFVTKAAQARGKSYEDFEPLARGRVWIGTDAFANGLVDELGDLKKAIQIAAEHAEITDYRLQTFPEPKDFWQVLLDSPSSAVRAPKLFAALRNMVPNELKLLLDLSLAQGRVEVLNLAIPLYHFEVQ